MPYRILRSLTIGFVVFALIMAGAWLPVPISALTGWPLDAVSVVTFPLFFIVAVALVVFVATPPERD